MEVKIIKIKRKEIGLTKEIHVDTTFAVAKKKKILILFEKF